MVGQNKRELNLSSDIWHLLRHIGLCKPRERWWRNMVCTISTVEVHMADSCPAGKYKDGPEKLAEARFRRLLELGLVEEGTESPPFIGGSKYDWDNLDPADRARSSRAMEVYAAMVELIDQEVGRLVDYLKATNEYDDTFILFMSDNGAEGAALEAIPVSFSLHLQRSY
jgi:arylsulfatase A-like enzyme